MDAVMHTANTPSDSMIQPMGLFNPERHHGQL